MNASTQSYKLLIRLYLLNRKALYINYYEKFKLLQAWLCPTEASYKPVIDVGRAPMYCASCFHSFGDLTTHGGMMFITCGSCGRQSNMMYELDRISGMLNISYNETIYLFCDAIAWLKENNKNIIITMQAAYFR